jgi:hypothetical protein
MLRGDINAKRGYLCQEGKFMRRGDIYAKRGYLCQEGKFMPIGEIYAERGRGISFKGSIASDPLSRPT